MRVAVDEEIFVACRNCEEEEHGEKNNLKFWERKYLERYIQLNQKDFRRSDWMALKTIYSGTFVLCLEGLYGFRYRRFLIVLQSCQHVCFKIA